MTYNWLSVVMVKIKQVEQVVVFKYGLMVEKINEHIFFTVKTIIINGKWIS